MEGVNLDVDDKLFIEEIKQHRSIWDVRSEDYKDKVKKQSAWEDVCKNTVLDFQTKSEKERNSIIKNLTLKWEGIRDNYMRSIGKRTKSGKVGQKYIHAKHISFLQESTMALAATQSSTEGPSVDSPSSQAAQDKESTSSDPVASSDPTTPGAICGATGAAALESSLIQSMNTPAIAEPAESNRSFFDSLIPMINDFSEDQTLQFRSEVLQLIRSMKGQTVVSLQTQATTSNPTQTPLLIPPIKSRFPIPTYNPAVQQRQQQARRFYQAINFPPPQRIAQVIPRASYQRPVPITPRRLPRPQHLSSLCSQAIIAGFGPRAKM